MTIQITTGNYVTTNTLQQLIVNALSNGDYSLEAVRVQNTNDVASAGLITSVGVSPPTTRNLSQIATMSVTVGGVTVTAEQVVGFIAAIADQLYQADIAAPATPAP